MTLTAAAAAAAAVRPVLAAGLALPAGWVMAGWGRRVCDSDSHWLRGWVVAAVAAALAWVAVGLAGSWWEAVPFWILGVVSALLICCDLAVMRLPDPIMGWAYPVVLGTLTIAAGGSDQWLRLGRALLAGVLFLAFYLVNALVFPRGIYLGDVKFAGLIGAWLGWFGWLHLVWGALLAAILGGVVGLVLILLRRGGLRTEYPYGPMIAAGAWIAAVWLI